MRLKWTYIIVLWVLIWNCAPVAMEDISYDVNKDSINIEYAGVRSSAYGIRPFPDAVGWAKAISAVQKNFPKSIPCSIWIVGRLKEPKTCFLEFPNPGTGHYKNIEFATTDKHEDYLSHFDNEGIKVFLQVEPAHGDMETLIDLVLNQYKHHPCVIGFGVDVEWYREADKPGWGIRVDDDSARKWEERVKSHQSQYRLFLKHWDRRWMPRKYRGNIIFVDDRQMLKSLKPMVIEFARYWAEYFKPNTVFYQIGYRSDKKWWQKLPNPAKEIGLAIGQNVDQKCGIFWVDFTLNDVISLK